MQAGLLVQVNPELLIEAFGVLAKDTCWENTSLDVSIVQPRLECNKCGAENEFPSAQCRKCASRDLSVRGGDDLVITQATFETAGSVKG